MRRRVIGTVAGKQPWWRLRNGTGPSQKIASWCTISMGFAVVIENEFDALQVTERRAITTGGPGNRNGG